MSSFSLAALRKRSNYPAFRVFINLIAGLGYLLSAALIVLGAIALGRVGIGDGVGPLMLVAGGVVSAFLVLVGTEVSCMVADIADCTVDQMARRVASENAGEGASG